MGQIDSLLYAKFCEIILILEGFIAKISLLAE